MALAYGTVQRAATLDHVAARALQPARVEALDPPVLAALRLGLFQLLFLDGVAEHAAVNESVELAKRGRRGGGGLVNAVLRRATREGRGLLDALDDARSRAAAAVRHSVPEWLAELWWRRARAADRARALLRPRSTTPAESALRVNTLVGRRRTTVAAAAAAWPTRPAPRLPEGLVLEAPFDAHGSELWREGAIMPQSRASMLVARALDPEPGERVLDLCAAPGAKTTHLAALMGDEASWSRSSATPAARAALERDLRADAVPLRPRRGRRRGRRAAATAASTACSSTRRAAASARCSRARPALARQPGADRRARPRCRRGSWPPGPRPRRPGGVARLLGVHDLPRGAEEVVGGFLGDHPEFALEQLGDVSAWRHADGQLLQSLPDRDGTDGFFIARLRRRGDHGAAGGRTAVGAVDRRYTLARERTPSSSAPSAPAAASRGCGRRRCRAATAASTACSAIELVSVCPNCGEHSTIVRMSSTAIVACNHCHGSMLQAV